MIENYANQLSVACHKLNKAKVALINGKILNILGVINLDKMNNLDKRKGNSIWINVNFQELRDKKSYHFSFSFKTKNLADLLSFSIYLIDSDNTKITFTDSKKN